MMNFMGEFHIGLLPPFLSISVFCSEELLEPLIETVAYKPILLQKQLTFFNFKSLAEMLEISKVRWLILEI